MGFSAAVSAVVVVVHHRTHGRATNAHTAVARIGCQGTRCGGAAGGGGGGGGGRW